MKFISNVEEFDNLLKNKSVVIVKFTASWCGPCKKIQPVFEDLAQKQSEVTTLEFAVVDVDQLPEVAERYGVEAMPTFIAVSKVVESIKANKDQQFVVKGANPGSLESLVDNCVTELKNLSTMAALFASAFLNQQQQQSSAKQEQSSAAKEQSSSSSQQEKSLEERKAAMKKKIEEKQAAKAKIAEEKAMSAEKERIEFAKKAAEANRLRQQIREETEMKERARQRKLEEEHARKVREQVRLEKLERQKKKKVGTTSATSTTSSTTNGQINLVVRGLNGERFRSPFNLSTRLLEVKHNWLVDQCKAASDVAAFDLLQNYPQARLSAADHEKSLADLGFNGRSATLLMVATGQSADLPSESSHTRESAVTWADYLSVTFPFSILYSIWVSVFGSSKGQTLPQPPEPNGNQHSSSFSSTSTESSSRQTSRSGGFGSIGELRRRHPSSQNGSGADEEFYNGNSTNFQ